MATQASNILGAQGLSNLASKASGGLIQGTTGSNDLASPNNPKPAGLVQSFLSSSPPKQQPTKTTVTDALGNTVTHNYASATPSTNSKPAPTQASSITQAGQPIIDTSGNAGVSDFDPNTGKPLSNPYGNGLLGQATFPGLVNSTANSSVTAANTGSSNYNTANTGLLNSLPNNQTLAQNAQDIANKYSAMANPYLAKAKNEEIGNIGTGLAPVGQGIASTIQGAAGNYLSGLSAQESQELAANNQGLAAQGQTQSGFNEASGNALTSQGQGITGSGNAASLAKPSSAGSGYVIIDPQTGKPVGSPDSAEAAAVQGSLIDSNATNAGSLNTNINNAQALLPAADNNFSVLQSIASQGATNPSSPILSQLQQAYGQTVGGQDAPAVAQFKSQLQAVRQAYTNLGLGDGAQAIPDSVTPSQLTQIKQSIDSSVANNLNGWQSQLNNLKGGNSSSGTSNSSQGSTSGFGWNG